MKIQVCESLFWFLISRWALLVTFERDLHLWKALVRAGLQSKSPRSMTPPIPWYQAISLFFSWKKSVGCLLWKYPIKIFWESHSGDFWEGDVSIAIDINCVPQGSPLIILQKKGHREEKSCNCFPFLSFNILTHLLLRSMTRQLGRDLRPADWAHLGFFKTLSQSSFLKKKTSHGEIYAPSRLSPSWICSTP